MTMRKELKSYSSIGNRAGILLLCKKVLTGHLEDLPSIETSCAFINGVDLNFKCGIIAFEELNLISISNKKCISKELLYNEENETLFIRQLCNHCMNVLIDLDLLQVDNLQYNEVNDCFQMPSYAFSFESSVYRNMLITLGALSPEGSFFTINENFETVFANHISKKRKVTQLQILETIEKERMMGEKGEEFVLNYEKKRCPFSTEQLNKIKQISIVDATAGFDIQSFENELSASKRYIEVKTYSGRVHFYWSTNEVEAARLRGNSYYIYLVDFSKIGQDDYSPIIIPNPYVNLQTMTVWDMHPASYEVSTQHLESEIRQKIDV